MVFVWFTPAVVLIRRPSTCNKYIKLFGKHFRMEYVAASNICVENLLNYEDFYVTFSRNEFKRRF